MDRDQPPAVLHVTGCTVCGAITAVTTPDGESMGAPGLHASWHRDEPPRRLITEAADLAKYRAEVDRHMKRLADDFTAALPQDARDAGIRVEWTGTADGA